MNVFRLLGDSLHLFSILWLLLKLIKYRSCGGISGKTQLMFAIVYTTRYLDLFFSYISVYNTTFKITYIVCYYVIVLLIFVVFSKSYRSSEDTFSTELLLVPSFALSLWYAHEMSPTEILWTFSIHLEALAILPQFYMIYKKGEIEKSLLYYLIPLGLYRLFYVFNWVYRYYYEGYFDRVADTAGMVYVAIYVFALIEFCVIRIKVTDEEKGTFLKNNIFFISNNEPYRQIVSEGNPPSEQPIGGKRGLESPIFEV